MITGRGEPAQLLFGGPPTVDNPSWIPESDWILLECSEPTHVCAVSMAGQLVRLTVGGSPVQSVVDTTRLLTGTSPQFLEPGYLVYGAPARNALMGARINPRTLEILGTPEVVVDGVRRESGGNMQFSVSRSGDLVLARGPSVDRALVVRAARDASLDTLRVPSDVYGALSLSFDDRMLSIRKYTEVGSTELWFYDLERDAPGVQWASGVPIGRTPWLPDSRSVIARIDSTIVRIDARSARGFTELRSIAGLGAPVDVTMDGRVLFVDSAGFGSARATLVAVEDLSRPGELPGTPLSIAVPGLGGLADLSPDGDWLAYTATALGEFEGQYEVYAGRLSENFSAIRVSSGLGESPRWSPRGDGLFYRSRNRYYWVPFDPSQPQPFGEPELFASGTFNNIAGLAEEVSSSGDALLLLLGTGSATTHTLDFIENFRARLVDQLGPVN